MTCSALESDRPRLPERTRAAGYSSLALEVVARIESAASKAEVLGLFRQAAQCLGADAALFMSFIRDDATFASYRFLLACDPVWGTEYARNGWFADDPWLRYAMNASEPIRSSELAPLTPREAIVATAAADYGFRSVVIVPTPSPAGHSRLGLMCVGSNTEGYFEDAGYQAVKLLSRCLALELQGWWQRQITAELIARSRISQSDLELLRHEDAGHSSKVIAADLQIEAKTIDCRFQRVSAKLGTPNRRAAVRIAKLYGLL